MPSSWRSRAKDHRTRAVGSMELKDGESNAFYENAVVRRSRRKSWEYQKLHKNHSLALFRNTPPFGAGILYFAARSL